MGHTYELEPVVLDGERFSGLGERVLIAPTREEVRVADDDWLGFLKAVEAHRRTFDLQEIVRWEFANGF